MFKKILACLFVVVCFVYSITPVFAGRCSTKYPIVLAHGMGASAEILGIVDYWWKIPEALRANGAKVYVTSVNGMDSTRNKALDFKRQVLEILAVSGAQKVNIIGHSHGTIYSRDAISNLGLAPYVASHTSICGPHKGSSVADLIMYNTPDFVRDILGDSLDFVYAYIFGDTNPNSVQNGYDVCTDYMKNVFNPNTPNMPGIYYQSWASKIKWAAPTLVLEPTWLYLLAKEGANDGLVSVESAKWGNFRGTISGAWWSPGVDHINMIGHFFGITPGFDAEEFYVELVEDLKNRGY